MKKQAIAVLAATIFLLLPVIPAGAYNFYLDDLLITKPGYTWYNDTFGDGNPPPMGVPFIDQHGVIWGMGNYIGNGLFPFGAGTFPTGTEVNGKLHFDSQYGAVAGVTTPGYKSWIQNARLKAWRAEFPGQSVNYLFKSDIFTVSARYDLIEPAEGEAYMLRLYDPGDPGPTPTGGYIQVRVRKGFGAAEATIQFMRADYYQDGGKTWSAAQNIGPEIPLDLTSGWEQIVLSLDHPVGRSKEITASFTYLDLNGTMMPMTYVYAEKGTIFNTDTQPWTDAEFLAGRSVRIPEPVSLALLGIGLAGVAMIRRRLRG